MTPAEMFQQSGALLTGHFQLTSGLHSPHYFQCALVLQHPAFATALCGQLVEAFRGEPVDSVIAPAVGGIVVAVEVGRQLGIPARFAERKDGAMQLRRGFELTPGEVLGGDGLFAVSGRSVWKAHLPDVPRLGRLE